MARTTTTMRSTKEPPRANLADLPFELLSHVYEHLPAAQSVSRLSQTCKKLHAFSRKEGWKAFVRTRFPSLQTPPDLRDYGEAAHGLTTLSRSWDRKAFLARYVEPSGFITDATTGSQIHQWHSPSGQTMGYRPSIDSYEEWPVVHNITNERDWSSRRQVLAWSAGSQLIIRVQETGSLARRAWKNSQNSEDPGRLFDDHRHFTRWSTWRHKGSREGLDDITAVNLVKPIHRTTNTAGTEHILVGTASGRLDIVSNSGNQSRYSPIVSYATNNQSVCSTDFSQAASSPFIAAALSDCKLALYPLRLGPEAEQVKPLSEFSAIPEGKKDFRIWTTKILSDSRVALGLGPSTEPVHVYEVTPSGIDPNPVRKFGLDGTRWNADDRVEFEPQTKKSSSVYPITPLPSTSQAGHAPGQVFLSGCYDGIIRVHDMRSPAAHVSSYWDPIDDAAIFSLQTIGRERLVAGGSRHSMMKVFDLRVAGGRAYHYLDAQKLQQTATVEADDESRPSHGWNVFITPPDRTFTNHRSRRRPSSPIYSLSTPSSMSPVIFAGLENAVVQFDFVSILDRHPDPLYSYGVQRYSRTGDIDVKKTWNSQNKVLSLGMYEQGGSNMRLRVQRGVGKYRLRDEERVGDLDERWADASDVNSLGRR